MIDEMLLSGFKIISLCLSGHRPDGACCVRLCFTSFQSRFSALCKCNFLHNSTESTLRSHAKVPRLVFFCVLFLENVFFYASWLHINLGVANFVLAVIYSTGLLLGAVHCVLEQI